MSWSGLLMNGSGIPASLVGMPNDWKPPPIGTGAEIRSKISAAFLHIEWQGMYGRLEYESTAIEFSVRDEVSVECVGLRIVGSSNPMLALSELCSRNGWVIYDTQLGDIVDSGRASEGWEAYISWVFEVADQTRKV